MSILKNYRFWIAFVIGLYTLLGFLVVPNIALKQINKYTQENFEQKISVDHISFNPFSFSVALHQIQIHEPKTDKLLFSALEINTNLQLWSLLTNNINLDVIEIFHPQVIAIREKDGSFNLAQIQPKATNSKETKSTPSQTFFSIDELIVENGTIHFNDETLEKPFETTISEFYCSLTDIDTEPNSLGGYNIALKIDEQTQFNLSGGIYIDPLLIYGNVDLKDFATHFPMPYIKDKLNFDISNTHLSTQFGFVANLHDLKNPRVQIESANLQIDPLQIKPKNSNEVLVSFEAFDLSELYFDLISQKLEIGSIDFTKLYTNTKIDSNGQTNLIKTFAPPSNKEENEEPSKPIDLLIHNINLYNAKVDIQDNLAGNGFQTSIDEINSSIQNITLQPNELAEFNISLKALESAAIKNSGTFSLNPLKIKSSFDLSNLKVNKLSPYYQNALNFDIIDATFNTQGEFSFDSTANNNVVLNNTNATIDKVKLSPKQSGKPLITLEQFNSNDISLDLNTQTINIGAITFDTLFSDITINKNKELNLSEMFASNNQGNTQTTNSKPWRLNIANTKLQNSSIAFQDESLKKTFQTNITTINANIDNLSLDKNSKAKLALNLKANNSGKINLDGELTLDPLKFNTKYKVSGLQLPFIQPYIQETLNLDLNKATLYTSGSFTYQDKFNYFNLYSYVTLNNIQLSHKLTNKELIKLKKLQIKALNLSKNNLKIKAISILEPTLTANIYDDATTNFKDLMVTTAEENAVEEKEEKSTRTFNYDIGPVTVSEGLMHFSDATLPFYFATDIHDINGDFSQLNSDFSKPSVINLKGQIDEYGFADISGETTTADWTNNTTINMYFKNISMKNYSPYSGKFVGRTIEGGSLNLDLSYDIKDAQLNAQNSIMLEKIQLGENVESPDASSLPLDLAIALLEDSNGIIDINLPITGDVNDPQFSVGHIVWKAFGKLIFSIVAAPFKLLGALLGSDDAQLDRVVFEPGKFELLAPAKESLDKVMEALAKRPNLQLALQPAYTQEIDKYGLQQIVLDQYLLAELEEDIHDKDDLMDELEDLYEDNISEEKLDALEVEFTKIVKNEKTGQEVEEFDQDGYITKLKDDLIRIQKLPDGALEKLAHDRTETIKQYLLEKAIDQNKISIKEEVMAIESTDPKWAQYKLDVAINKNEVKTEQPIKEEQPL